MKHLSKLYVAVFVLAWLAGLLFGGLGFLAASAVVATLQLLLWRTDMVRLPSFRRVWELVPKPLRRGPAPWYDDVRHAVVMGAHSRREFDFTLRRRLERIASSRLDDVHGVDLHRDSARARELLGDEAWSLLDPSRPVSGERTRGGVDPAALERIVARLENL